MSADQSSLRVACVGAGYFSQFHYASWARLDRVNLVGACDSDLVKAQAIGLPAFDRLEMMLEQTRPDLLDIILPPVAHASAIHTALKAGVRAIVCQKPFCMNLAEAHAITKAADAAGTKLIVHENFRFQPWYRQIRQALTQGMLGDLHQMTFRLRPGDGQGPDAYLDRQPYFQKMERFLIHETAVHWIDVFRYLLGEPTAVYADLRRENPVISGEDAGYVLFDHPGGVRALFDANRHLDHAAENHRCTMGEALIEGSAGTLRLLGDGAVQFRKFGELSEVEILAPDQNGGFGGDCVHALQKHLVAGLLDGAVIENQASDYLQVIDIEDAIYRSAQENRKIALSSLTGH